MEPGGSGRNPQAAVNLDVCMAVMGAQQAAAEARLPTLMLLLWVEAETLLQDPGWLRRRWT